MPAADSCGSADPNFSVSVERFKYDGIIKVRTTQWLTTDYSHSVPLRLLGIGYQALCADNSGRGYMAW